MRNYTKQKGSAVKCCRKCDEDLIPGVNIYESQFKIQSYICIDCKLKYEKKRYPEWYAKNFKAHLIRIKKFKKSIPSGIYFIFHKNTKELLYIGESSQVYERIYGKHFSVNTNSPISKLITNGELDRHELDFFLYKEVDDETQRKKLEAKLIKQLQPTLNQKWK